MTSYKTCAVPMCKSTTVKCPDKLFINVPKSVKRRKQWLKLARREFTSEKCTMHFCEDHFDLPNDMMNFMEYHVMGRVSKVRIKPTSLPTKFQCQTNNIKQQNITKQQQTLKKQIFEEASNYLDEKAMTNPLELDETSSTSSDDTWSLKSTSDKEILTKEASSDNENNMPLTEESDNTFLNLEDTKIFTQQWNSEMSDNEPICRICLAVDVKMYNIGDYKLKQCYQNFTGIQSSLEDTLPKMICWECVARLQTANSFREKVLRSYNLLLCQVKTDTTLSMSDVRSINRVENRLQSTLAMKNIKDDSTIWTTHSDDVSEDEMSLVLKLEVEDDGQEAVPQETVPQDNEDSNDTCDQDPLEYSQPISRRRAPPTLRQRRADTAKARANRTTRPNPRKAVVLDSAIFVVLEVPLERAVADVAQRATRAEFRAAPHRCDLCYKVFATPTARDEHAVRHSDAMGEFECVVCRCRWRTSTALRKHFTESHTREFLCKMCTFTTKNRGVAKRHERFHKGVKFQCSRCPKEFASQTAYLSHLRLNHVCRFPCGYCGFAFHTRRGVDSHKLKKHKRDKNLELAGPHCTECDVQFVTDEAHDRHLQLTAAHRRDDNNGRRIRNDYHIAEKSRCKWKSVKAKTEHTKPELAEPESGVQVRCEQCGEECEGYRAYAQHFRRQHPGCNRTQYSSTDPAMCEHCGKIFQNPCLLRAHAVAHEDGAAPSGLRRAGGRLAGTPRRTHACPLCPKRFTEKSNRSRHISTIHQGAERRFRCAVCDKRFWERSGLQSHYDHVHLKKPWPKRTRPPRPRPAPVPGQELVSAGKDTSAEV